MSNKYLDEDDVVYLTTDIKTLSDATYEPKKLKFINTVVSVNSFDKNQDTYTITITPNSENTDSQYLTIDQTLFDSQFLELGLSSGTYTFIIGNAFTITPGNKQTAELEWDNTNRNYSVPSWGILLDHNSYTPNQVLFTITYVAPHIVSPYSDFPCKATIPLTNVTSTMIPDVIFSLSDALSGNYAPIAETYSGGIYIYSVEIPSSSITIPTIICWAN